MFVERCLAWLGDESKPVAGLRLAHLSDLSTKELRLFKGAWGRIGVSRRQQIVHQLVILAENDPKVNFDTIFKFCLDDPDPKVREKAIQGLWECDDCTLIPILIELLTKDEVASVRAAASSILGKFITLAVQERVNPRRITKIVEALLQVIYSEEEIEVRCRAVEALAPLHLPRVKEAIHATYQSDNPKLKANALRAMGRSGDPSWLPILLKELNNPDPGMRLEAVRACGELGEEEAAFHLVKFIHDPDAKVRAAATKALGQIAGRD